MPRADTLGVWLGATRVGELTRRGPHRVRFRYGDEALARWPRNVPVLSCALPLGDRAVDATRWFRGLLPEGAHLQALADRAGVATNDTFGLLARYGRDVAGAVVVSAVEPGDRAEGVVPYGPDELDHEVAGLDEHPLGVHDDSELSIAGLQNKLLLVREDGGWARPVHGRASTHILKLEDRRFPGLVRAEAACLALARAVGLTTVDATTETLAGIDCIVVSRYDRRLDAGGAVVRIHQEDACQACDTDIDQQHRRGKYEAFGGPGFADVARLLDAHAADPVGELERLLQVAVFTVAIGNSDAHGKNLSLLHDGDGTIRLAPLYDTVPTARWPSLPRRAAMHIGGCAVLDDVRLDHLVAEARRWPLVEAHARRVVGAFGEVLHEAAGEALPEDLAVAVRERLGRLLSGR